MYINQSTGAAPYDAVTSLPHHSAAAVAAARQSKLGGAGKVAQTAGQQCRCAVTRL